MPAFNGDMTTSVADDDQHQQQEQEQAPVTFSAQLQNAKFFLNFLKAINFKDDVTLVIASNGLKLTVEDSKSFQANAYVQRALFRRFDLEGGGGGGDDAVVSFRLDMSSLVHCLSLFGYGPQGGAPVLCMKHTEGEPLKLWLEDGGVVTEVQARTRVAADILDFDFNKATVAAKVILQAEKLRDALADLDLSGEHVDITVDGPGREIRFGTAGAMLETTVTIPADSAVVSHFSASECVGARYKVGLFRSAVRPIALSEKVSVRIDRRDVLCWQYMVSVEGEKSFLEFICLPDGKETPD